MCAACATPTPPAAENAGAAVFLAADAALQDYQLRDLETHIQAMPPGFERDYFAGMLAARSGRFGNAIAELKRALPQLRESAPKRAAMALETIATAYRADNNYRDAARAYAELSERFADQLDRFPKDDAALARILSGTPPQSMSRDGPVKLRTSRNPIGSRVVELVVNGVRGPWLLDTGANQSVVSRTFAKRIGVTPLPGMASVGSALTGQKSSLQVAVLPAMLVGRAALENIVLLVLDDANLRIGSGRDAYQIDAILGYPVLKALGTVTFTRDEFLAGEAASDDGRGVRMYMRGLTPAIECEVEGRPLLFTFDTGASSSELSVRYFELFRAHADSWKSERIETAGAGGSVTHDVYIQPRLVMTLGRATVSLRDVSMSTVRVNTPSDMLFGNLGQDFVDGFESFSLNFSTMTFSVDPSRDVRP